MLIFYAPTEHFVKHLCCISFEGPASLLSNCKEHESIWVIPDRPAEKQTDSFFFFFFWISGRRLRRRGKPKRLESDTVRTTLEGRDVVKEAVRSSAITLSEQHQEIFEISKSFSYRDINLKTFQYEWTFSASSCN